MYLSTDFFISKVKGKICQGRPYNKNRGVRQHRAMVIKKPSDIASSEITPKSTYINRRKFITGAAATVGAALAGGLYLRNHLENGTTVHAGGAKLSGIVKSPVSTTETPNSFQDITNYNNYYEFSTDEYEP